MILNILKYITEIIKHCFKHPLLILFKTALTFLNNDCKLVHNNVCIASVLVNRAGDWKLAAFEYSHSIESESTNQHKVLTSLDCYEPPEKLASNNLNTNRNSIQTESAVDSYGFACLIWEIFNGLLPNRDALKRPGKYKYVININLCFFFKN